MEEQKPQLEKNKSRGGMIDRIKAQVAAERKRMDMVLSEQALAMAIEYGSVGKARRVLESRQRRAERAKRKLAMRIVRNATRPKSLTAEPMRGRDRIKKRRRMNAARQKARKQQAREAERAARA